MKLHIEIIDEQEQRAIKKLAKKHEWSFNKLGQVAIRFYLRARKVIKGK